METRLLLILVNLILFFSCLLFIAFSKHLLDFFLKNVKMCLWRRNIKWLTILWDWHSCLVLMYSILVDDFISFWFALLQNILFNFCEVKSINFGIKLIFLNIGVQIPKSICISPYEIAMFFFVDFGKIEKENSTPQDNLHKICQLQNIFVASIFFYWLLLFYFKKKRKLYLIKSYTKENRLES